jgi:phosphoglycerate dehydrogenase-like enzyme
MIRDAPRVRWVQLPYAGIEPFADYLDPRFVWTCGKGVYAPPVAEHALALILAGLRNIGAYARADRWTAPAGRNLIGARVLILGGGGISRSLIDLLTPFGCDITVFRHRDAPVGTTRVITERRQLHELLPTADVVVIALALTADTHGIVDRAFLTRLAPNAWLINVGRGGHVVTDDLVAALAEQRIGGAALDVTDPEPLPEGHPLWSLPNCIITPHIANTPEMGLPLIAARVRENTTRFVAGEPLVGLVDVALGY